MQQQVLSKQLLHKDFLRRLEDAHRRVQAELATNRATQAGDFNKTGLRKVDLEVMERAKAEFPSLYQRSLVVAERLSTERVIISKEDAWLSQFGAGVVLEFVEAVVDGIDHVQLRSEISILRLERDRIVKAPPAADLGALGSWIDRGEADVRIDRLVARHPHFLNTDPELGIPNDLLAVILRDAMIGELASRINKQANAAIPPGERAGRLEAIDGELEGLLRIDAALVDRAISNGRDDLTHDRESAAWITLGVAARARELKLAS